MSALFSQELPFQSDDFAKCWELYKKIRKEKNKASQYKGPTQEQGGLAKLVRLSGGDERTAIRILKICIENSWIGMKYAVQEIQKENESGNTAQQLRSGFEKEFGKIRGF